MSAKRAAQRATPCNFAAPIEFLPHISMIQKISRMNKFWFWLLPALAWSNVGEAQEKTTYPPEKIVPTEKSLVWKISGNGLKKPSYLYGTIHMIPKNEFALPASVDAALDKTKQVAYEIDMKEMTSLHTQFSLITKAFMAGGQTLKNLLPKEDYALVKSKMAEKGLPGGMFERMKPLFLSTLFSSDEEGSPMANTSSMTSVEMELYRTARRRKLESTGLETAAFQMSVFDSIPYEAQAKMLVESLRSTDTTITGGESQLDQMLRMYREQDITAMQAMIDDEGSGMGQYGDVLLKKRNLNWIPVMNRLMRDKPTLFAVGAGHLGGESGVVALLRKEGYRVEPE
jgi:uncharacterized protein YbaP (TraB family)